MTSRVEIVPDGLRSSFIGGEAYNVFVVKVKLPNGKRVRISDAVRYGPAKRLAARLRKVLKHAANN